MKKLTTTILSLAVLLVLLMPTRAKAEEKNIIETLQEIIDFRPIYNSLKNEITDTDKRAKLQKVIEMFNGPVKLDRRPIDTVLPGQLQPGRR